MCEGIFQKTEIAKSFGCSLQLDLKRCQIGFKELKTIRNAAVCVRPYRTLVKIELFLWISLELIVYSI
jgi:hypothetical protein